MTLTLLATISCTLYMWTAFELGWEISQLVLSFFFIIQPENLFLIPKIFFAIKFSSTRMRTRFYTATAPHRHAQSSKKSARCKLTKEERAGVNARRRLASENYRKDLEAAWSTINEVTGDIAVKHHKSIRSVRSAIQMGHQLAGRQRKKTNMWNAFCWKKSQEKENSTV